MAAIHGFIRGKYLRTVLFLYNPQTEHQNHLPEPLAGFPLSIKMTFVASRLPRSFLRMYQCDVRTVKKRKRHLCLCSFWWKQACFYIQFGPSRYFNHLVCPQNQSGGALLRGTFSEQTGRVSVFDVKTGACSKRHLWNSSLSRCVEKPSLSGLLKLLFWAGCCSVCLGI